ncbi:hypothetical protein CLIB1423_43S00210 [[Candida] railenensis]|uniref:Uncharacterized protein n=1 Tax=[Candida] railenensis TaxID=45579 RepID=A0A9P0QVY2_9ASCO|nr:hypothetical protein CLIB1423_43S00210 [[Candida] railenensis]
MLVVRQDQITGNSQNVSVPKKISYMGGVKKTLKESYVPNDNECITTHIKLAKPYCSESQDSSNELDAITV